MFERAALVHYHEIGLKGRNRSSFEHVCATTSMRRVGDMTDARSERIPSRLLVRATDPARIDELCERVALQPGVGYAAPAYITSRDDQTSTAPGCLRCARPRTQRRSLSMRGDPTPIFLSSSLEMNIAIGQHSWTRPVWGESGSTPT